MERATVAIIGAGVAGLACARALRRANIEVTLYDKGRGPGGRCSTRRSPFGRFDHGAQFFTARDDRFLEQLDEWRRAEIVAPWTGRHVTIERGRTELAGDEARFVGVPGMNAFVRHEAEIAKAQFGLRMGPPARQATGPRWMLRSEAGRSAWEAEWIVFAVPAEQVPPLVPGIAEGGSSDLTAAASEARSSPTWTLMAAFDGGGAAPFDSASIADDDVAWISREESKPGRDIGARWVAHASGEWSTSHIEEGQAAIIEGLVPTLRRLIGEEGRLIHADAHRWRYARVTRTAEKPFGLDADAQLATCGDWHVAPRIESAWVSGDALGRALAARL